MLGRIGIRTDVIPWRMLLAFAGTGSAAAFAYRGDWLAAGVMLTAVLIPAVLWVRGQLLATRAMIRGSQWRTAQDAAMAAHTAVARTYLPLRKRIRRFISRRGGRSRWALKMARPLFRYHDARGEPGAPARYTPR